MALSFGLKLLEKRTESENALSEKIYKWEIIVIILHKPHTRQKGINTFYTASRPSLHFFFYEVYQVDEVCEDRWTSR